MTVGGVNNLCSMRALTVEKDAVDILWDDTAYWKETYVSSVWIGRARDSFWELGELLGRSQRDGRSTITLDWKDGGQTHRS